MYLKAEVCWSVVIAPKSLHNDGVKFQTELSRRLLNDFSEERATKDLGYLLAVTTVESIGEGKVRPDTGKVKFPVVFNCITFKLFVGEIIHAVVYKVMKHGVCLRCGPVENLFLSAKKIPDYQYIPRVEDPVFLNPEKQQSRLGKMTQFAVLSLRLDGLTQIGNSPCWLLCRIYDRETYLRKLLMVGSCLRAAYDRSGTIS